MGLFGLDANSSSSSLNQAQVSSQYGAAYGANTGKGAASSNASGTTTIGGGVKVGKGATLVINNTNTQLENSILGSLTSISSLLQGGNSQGGDTGSSSSGLGGLLGGSSSKSGAGGKAGTGGSVEGGNITIDPNHGASAISDLIGNQALNTQSTNELVDQLNSGGSSDISDVSHPHGGGFIFNPTSSGDTNSNASGLSSGTVISIAAGLVVIGVAFLYFKNR